MVGKIAPKSAHLTKGMVKYIPRGDFSCRPHTKRGQIGDHPPPSFVERGLGAGVHYVGMKCWGFFDYGFHLHKVGWKQLL